MMVVRKASEDYYYSFEEETDVIKLFKKYGPIVIERNYEFNEDPYRIIQFWEHLTIEDAKKIVRCQYEILIYDDYLS